MEEHDPGYTEERAVRESGIDIYKHGDLTECPMGCGSTAGDEFHCPDCGWEASLDEELVRNGQ